MSTGKAVGTGAVAGKGVEMQLVIGMQNNIIINEFQVISEIFLYFRLEIIVI